MKFLSGNNHFFIGRQWVYQTCTEFGFYQTSDNVNLLFGNRFDVDFFIKQCEDIYGTRFDNVALTKAIKRTNTYYGALHAPTTNVIYVHGSIDPWHALGLTKSDDPAKPTIYITGEMKSLLSFILLIILFFRNCTLCQYVWTAGSWFSTIKRSTVKNQ